GFVTAHLLVERIKQLLPGGGASEGGAMIEGAAESAKIQQALSGAIEGNAHAVEQVDDGGRGVAHITHWWLVGEKVAAVDGVVKVLRSGVAFALEILCRIDAALRADGMRALHRHDGK